MAVGRQGWNHVSGLEVNLGRKAAAQGPRMSHRSSLRVCEEAGLPEWLSGNGKNCSQDT